jgi:hypothetical protein
LVAVNLTKSSEPPGFEEQPNAVYLPLIGRSDAVPGSDSSLSFPVQQHSAAVFTAIQFRKFAGGARRLRKWMLN